MLVNGKFKVSDIGNDIILDTTSKIMIIRVKYGIIVVRISS